jgi:S1-C subfamily serine protease
VTARAPSAARARLLLAVVVPLAALAFCPRPASGAPGALGLVEKEYAAAIRRVTPATVVCVAKGAERHVDGSSGVLVTRDGYVLSDIDASNPTGRLPRRLVDDVDVRVPDAKRGFTVHPARVIARDEALDTTLLKIVKPPPSGFPFVPLGSADDLRVGSITFITGNSFGLSKEATPTLTAGVVSGLVRAKEGAPGGRNLEIYSSAAVNPGVNGGPVVDVEGRLVGVVSTWIEPSGHPSSPFQSLSKAFPVDRLRAFYAGKPGADRVFAPAKETPARSKQAERVEAALAEVALAAVEGVVSLTVSRSEPLRVEVPNSARDSARGGREEPPTVPLPRYDGPVSGVLVSRDGWIVTSLYNLADTMALGGLPLPNRVADGLGKIVSVTAHLRTGRDVPARVVAHDQHLGVALLKAETGEEATEVWEPAPEESAQVGRFALCVGNPFGSGHAPDPLLTVGIVSRVHDDESDEPWRNNVQTDAPVTDATCGGALVDLHGRLLGVATIWAPTMHGRAAGIGFGVRWAQVVQALPAMKEGKSRRAGAFLGVGFEGDVGRIGEVRPGSPAAKAGLQVGDRIAKVGGVETPTSRDVVRKIRERSPGDPLRLTVEREGRTREVEVVLVERSASG